MPQNDGVTATKIHVEHLSEYWRDELLDQINVFRCTKCDTYYTINAELETDPLAFSTLSAHLRQAMLDEHASGHPSPFLCVAATTHGH